MPGWFSRRGLAAMCCPAVLAGALSACTPVTPTPSATDTGTATAGPLPPTESPPLTPAATGSGQSGLDTSTPASSAAGQSGSVPQRGGVLTLAGSAHALDTFDVLTGSTATAGLLRGLSRQLLSYRSGPQFSEVVREVTADAATEVPLPQNGATYTFRLRGGLVWDAANPRPVVAADFARGIKRLCNPVLPSDSAGYFAATISGMAGFCDGFARLGAKASAQAMRAYVDTHDVGGLQTPDAATLVVTLNAPASDFLRMMALTAASAVPAEAMGYLPGSDAWRAHFISDGPYTIASLQPGVSLTLTRNSHWDPATDPVRAAYADEVHIRLGLSETAAQAQVEAGTADFTTDLFAPPPAVTAKLGDPRMQSVTDGSLTYLAFRVQSPAAGHALAKVSVRQALALATDKSAVVRAAGGPEVAEPLASVLTPQILGYRPTDTYRTPRDAGDPAKARELLAAAGYPAGLTLRMLYGTGERSAAIAASVQAAWRAAGVSLTLTAVDDRQLRRLLAPGAAASPVAWDVVLAPRFEPAWYGNAARTFFTALLVSGAPRDFGGYRSSTVDALVARALGEPDDNKAATVWAHADEAVMADAPIVPLVTGRPAFYRSARVRHWAWGPTAYPDYTNVGLAPAG